MLEEDIAKSATLTQVKDMVKTWLGRSHIHNSYSHKVQYERLILQSSINNVMKQGKTH